MNHFQSLIAQSEDVGRARYPVLAGNSVVVHAMRQMVQLGASIHDPLLLCGPAGTGKSAIAHAVHALSAQEGDAFAAFDCAEITPKDERAIFARGSQWPGTRFKGSVFIDEINLLPSDMQEALYEWLIQNDAPKQRVRLFVATSRPLDSLVKARLFNADLFRCISRMTIPTVPLARRKGDIVDLIAAIWANDHSTLSPNLGKSGQQLLQNYDWPGNFPELQQTARLLAKIYGGRRVGADQIRRLSGQGVLNCSAVTPVFQTAANSQRKPPSLDLRAHLDREEAMILLAALERSGGIICDAAQITGINRTTFLNKMRRHGISRF